MQQLKQYYNIWQLPTSFDQMNKTNSKGVKDILFSKKIQDYNNEEIDYVIGRRSDGSRMVVCCKLKNLSVLHCVQFYQEQIDQQLIKDFQQRPCENDKLFQPLRIIQVSEEQKQVLKAADIASIRYLMESSITINNRERYLVERQNLPQQYQQNLEKVIVVVQWFGSEFTLEQAICVPNIIDLIQSGQTVIRRELQLVSDYNSQVAALQLCMNGDSHKLAQKCSISVVAENQQVRKLVVANSHSAFIDLQTLNSVSRDARSFICQMVLKIVEQNKRIVIISKFSSILINEFENRHFRVSELNSNSINQHMLIQGNYDVLFIQMQQVSNQNNQFEQFFHQLQNVDLLIVDELVKLDQIQIDYIKTKYKLLITRINNNQTEFINQFKYLMQLNQQQIDMLQQLSIEDKNDIMAFYELGYQYSLIQQHAQFDVLRVMQINRRVVGSEQVESSAITEKIIKPTDNYLKLKQSIEQYQQQEIQQNLILMINQTFEDKVRQRVFLDSDQVLFKILYDDRKGVLTQQPYQKIQTGKMTFSTYIAAVNFLVASLLRMLWIIEDSNQQNNKSPSDTIQYQLNPTRQQMLQMYIRSLNHNKKQSCLIIVPQEIILQTKQYLQQLENVNIIMQLHENIAYDIQKTNVVLITEQQLQVYYFIVCKFNQQLCQLEQLPMHIFFPVITGRCSDVIVDLIYKQLLPKQQPQILQVCALNTIEEHLLMYKQKMSFLMLQELNEFEEVIKQNNISKQAKVEAIYTELHQIIDLKGFDGLSEQNQTMDVHSFGPDFTQIDDNAKSYYSVPYVRGILCSFLHSDMILQAAFNDIFDIEYTYNIHNYAAECFGKEDVSLNINHDNKIYEQPGLLQVQITKNNQITVENVNLHYYQAQQNEVVIKGVKQRLLEYFAPVPQGTVALQIGETLTKINLNQEQFVGSHHIRQYYLKTNLQCDPQKCIKQSTVQENKKKRTKNYVEAPVMSLPARSNRNQINILTEYTQLPEKKPTLCLNCSKKEQIFSQMCDICGTKMKECYDLSAIEAIERNGFTHCQSLKELTPDRDIQRGIAEYVQNINLSSICYPGGQKHEHLLVTPLDHITDEQYELISNILQKEENKSKFAKALAAVVSLVDETNPTFPFQIKRKIDISNKLRGNISVWLQTYMNELLQNQKGTVSLGRLIKMAIPYDLFQISRLNSFYQDELLLIPINAGNLQQYANKYVFYYFENIYRLKRYVENYQFYDFQFQHGFVHNIKRMSDRFSQAGQANFIKLLLNQIISEDGVAYDNLKATSLFNNKLLLNDSYLTLCVLSNIHTLTKEFPQVKISLNALKLKSQYQIPPFIIQRAYRYHVRNAATHCQIFYLLDNQNQTKMSQLFQQSQNKEELTKYLVNLRWNPIQVLAGMYDSNSFQSEKGVYPDQKQIDFLVSELEHKNTVKLTAINQASQHISAQPTTNMQITGTQQVRMQNISNQNQYPQQQFNMNQQKPIKYPEAPQIAIPYNPIQPIVRQAPLQPNRQQVIIPTTVVSKTEPTDNQFKRKSQPNNSIRLLLIDEVIYAAEQRNINFNAVVQRIMHHYISKYYLVKNNLLYCPDVIITQKNSEVLPRQLGMNDEQLVNKLEHTTFHQFKDYVIQLCNQYNELSKQPVNPYKFFVLDEEKSRILNNYTSNSSVKLVKFNQLTICTEWVLKHQLLMDVDLKHSNVIYFQQDPVVGVDVWDQAALTDRCDRFSYHIDRQVSMKKDNEAMRQTFEHLCQDIGRFDQNVVNKVIKHVAQFSIGLGSSPNEVFSHYAKHFTQEQYILIARIIQLFSFCHFNDVKFPYEIENVTDLNCIAQTYQHMELMRLMHMKVEQIDYFIWLSRVQKLAKDKGQQTSLEQIQYFSRMSTVYDKDLAAFKLKQYEGDKQHTFIQDLYSQAESTEQINTKIIQIETIFCQFIQQQQGHYDKQRQYPLPCYAINDCDKTGIRKAWIVSATYKVIFITLFGSKYDNLVEICKEAYGDKEAEELLFQIRNLYMSILNLWSRFQDYLLTFLQLDYGNSEDIVRLMSQDESKLEEKITKKLNIIKPSRIVDNLEEVKDSPLTMIINQNSSNLVELSQLQPRSIQYQFSYFFEIIGIKAIADSTNPKQQIIQSLKNFGKINYKQIFKENNLMPEQLSKRLSDLKFALHTERNLLHAPHKLLEANCGYYVNQQKYLLKSQPNPTQPFPVNIPTINAAQQEQKKQKKKQEIEEGRPSSPMMPQQQNAQQNNQVQLNDEQTQLINFKPLSFYKESPGAVQKFIEDVMKKNEIYKTFEKSGQQLEQFLFMQSSCQRTHSDEWGRLYSFLINITPEPQEQSQRFAKEKQDQIVQIAQQIGIRAEGQSLNPDFWSRLYTVIEQPQNSRYNLNNITKEYVQRNLELAYFYAFRMREDVIRNPEVNVNQYKANIHSALKQMQVMNQFPLNQLIQEKDTLNKKKMALATYFFLAQNAK